MTGIGKRLKKLRQERDKTLDSVVADLNKLFPNVKLNKSMISRWENEQNEPSLDNARILCIYYGVSLDYLIGLTDEPFPPQSKHLMQYYKFLSDLSLEQIEDVQKYADFIKSKKL